MAIFPRPTPPTCRDCGASDLKGLGPRGNWDGYSCGGVIYQAECLHCGAVWSRYAWGLGEGEDPATIHWGKSGSTTDPPRLPPGLEVNPYTQICEGQVIIGVVKNVAPFGLFISLIPRLWGLLHFEGTPYPEIARTLCIGDQVEVFVRTVNVQTERVILELLPDPTHYEGFWSKRPRNEEAS